MLIVNLTHWLDEHGQLPDSPPRLRRNALRVARVTEYGGPLKRLQGRETLLECRRRPKGKACTGLMWVVKRPDDRLEAFCGGCHEVEMVVSGWVETQWADGPMEPVQMTDD